MNTFTIKMDTLERDEHEGQFGTCLIGTCNIIVVVSLCLTADKNLPTFQ